MIILKRMSGGLALLLGVLGVVASLAAIAGVLIVRSRVDGIVTQTFAKVDAAMASLEGRVEQINQRIGGVRESVDELNERVQQRVAEIGDMPLEEAADIDQIERRLYVRVEQAKDWFEFIQTSIDFIQQLMGMAESTSGFLQDDSKTMQDLVAAVQTGRDEIDKVEELAEDIRSGLNEIRANQDVAANMAKINTISSRIDEALAKADDYGHQLSTGLASARVRFAELGDEILWQVTTAAIVSMLLLLWAAVAQLSLAVHGRKMLRQSNGP